MSMLVWNKTAMTRTASPFAIESSKKKFIKMTVEAEEANETHVFGDITIFCY